MRTASGAPGSTASGVSSPGTSNSELTPPDATRAPRQFRFTVEHRQMAAAAGVSGSHLPMINSSPQLGRPSTDRSTSPRRGRRPPTLRFMSLPPVYSAASARAAGLTRGRLRGPAFLRIAHDLVVRLDDAIDARERLHLLATVLPPDAAYSHLTAAHLLGAHVDPPRRAHVALTPRRVLPQRAELVVHARRLQPGDVVDHADL